MPTVDLRAARAAYVPPTPVAPVIEEVIPEVIVPTEMGPDLCFPVEIRPLAVAYSGVAVDPDIAYDIITDSVGDLQVVVADNGPTDCKVLAVHGNRYRLIRNREVITSYENAVASINVVGTPGVSLTNPRIFNQLGDEGARMIRTYIYDNEQHDFLPNTPVTFEARLLNSYNGTFKTGVASGGRLQNTNFSLVWSESTVHAFGKHTSGLSLNSIMSSIDAAHQCFINECNQKQQLHNIPISLQTIRLCLQDTPLSNARAWNGILRRYNRFATLYGETAMSFYLALCEWATSGDEIRASAEDNQQVVRMNRERTVRKVLRNLN
jgi:hypothetical protein